MSAPIEYGPRFSSIRYGWLVPTFWRRLRVEYPWQFHRDDMVLVSRTGEMMRVRRVHRWLEVDRGVGCTPCSLRDGDEVLIVGNVGDPA